MASRHLGLVVFLSLALQCVAQDPNAPSLLFNWTLRPADVPLQLGSRWVPISNDANAPAVLSSIDSVSVEFVGSAVAFHGTSTGWGLIGSDGLPRRSATASVSGDATWISADSDDLFQSYSDSVLWQRSTPRFKEYTMGITKFSDGNWTLESAEIMTGMASTAASLADVPTRVEKIVNDDGSYNSIYNRTGRWEVIPATAELPAHAKCYDATAIMRVNIPRGTAYFLMHGVRSKLATGMYFTLQSDDKSSSSQTFMRDAEYPVTVEGLFFMWPLDPKKTYTLVWTCVYPTSYGEQRVTSMTFYEGSSADSSVGGWGSSNNTGTGTGSPSPSGGGDGSSSAGSDGTGTGTGTANNANSGSSSKLSKNAIIAIVVVGIVLVLALLLYLFIRRRSSRPPPVPPHGGMPAYQSGRIDGELDPNVYPSPYPMPAQGYAVPQGYGAPPLMQQSTGSAPPAYGGSVYNAGSPYSPHK